MVPFRSSIRRPTRSVGFMRRRIGSLRCTVLASAACLFGTAAFAQNITHVYVASTPTGGPLGNPESVYIIDDKIQVDVAYDTSLPVNIGSPWLQISLAGGSGIKEAPCGLDASRQHVLVCTYTVREDDYGDSVEILNASDTLQGGNLPSYDLAGATIRGDLSPVDGIGLTIDEGGINIAGVTPAAGFVEEDIIEVTLDFTHPRTTNTPLDADAPSWRHRDSPLWRPVVGVTLLLDNDEREMQHHEDNNNETMKFRYEAVAGDSAKKLRLRFTDAHRLRDNNGNEGLRLDKNVNELIADAATRRVDTQGPRIGDIHILNNANTFRATDTAQCSSSPRECEIEFRVDFDEKVLVTDANLLVDVGGDRRSAPCGDVATAMDMMTCTLTIAADWFDSDGLSTPADPLVFGSIEDDLGNDFVWRHTSHQFSDHRVDAVAPKIRSISITVPEARVGNSIVVRLTFSENVSVTGTPSVTLALERGDVLTDSWQTATYAGWSGSTVEFRYLLVDGDVDDYSETEGADNSPSVTLSVATVNGIMDVAGNPAVADLPATRPKSDLRYRRDADTTDSDVPWSDASRPSVLHATLLAPASGFFDMDDDIVVEVRFSKPVTFSNTGAELRLAIGSQTQHLALTREGAATSSLHTFRGNAGTLQAGARTATRRPDLLLHGSVRAGPIVLGEGESILDANNRGWINQPDANLREEGQSQATTVSVSQRGSAVVDTVRPEIESVKLLASPESTGIREDGVRFYGEGDRIQIEVTMSEDVIVDWQTPPQITLDVTDESGIAISPAPSADIVSGRRGKTLVFEYEVQSTHVDRNGISLTAITNTDSLADLAGNLCDSATNCSYSTLWASTVTATHPVDGTIYGDERPEDEIEAGPPVDTPDEAPDTPAPVAIASVTREGNPASGQFYRSGESITLVVNFAEAVDVSVLPGLTVNIGGTSRLARCSGAGTGVRSIRCSLPIEDGDEAPNGITLAGLSGGTIRADGQDVSRALPAILGGAPRVDARPPTIAGSPRFTSQGPYVLGRPIVVTVEFSEAVSWQGAPPTLSILIGREAKPAELQFPPANRPAREYEFRYLVATNDSDADGVSIAANSLSGRVEDAAGHAAGLAHEAVAGDSRHSVDTQGPTIADISLGDPKVYLQGETITITVTFSEPVAGARSTLALAIGSQVRRASLVQGNNTPELTFSYTVRAGDGGAVSVPTDALAGVTDTAGNPAAANAAEDFAGHVVDAAAPAVMGAPSIASQPVNGDTYAGGETIRIAVAFDDAVTVSGEPRMYLTVGDQRKEAAYASGSDSASLFFEYTVQENDLDADGVSVGANELESVGTATIRDRNGVNARLAHVALPDQPNHKVDAVAPTITGIEITSRPATGDSYIVGERIAVTVTFDENIEVLGTPALALTIGTELRDAHCAKDAQATLACRYAVVVGDVDRDGVAVAAGELAGGTITDAPGNAAARGHDALADDPSHKVLSPPALAAEVPAMSLVAGGEVETVELGEVFAGTLLTYEASSSDAAVAEATVSGNTLSVRSGMEGAATVTVTATNPAGSAATGFAVTVATDPMETAVLNDALAAIGRGMLSSTASVIGARFRLDPAGAQMTLGGRRLGGTLSPDLLRLHENADPRAALGAPEGWAVEPATHAGRSHGMTAARLLAGSAFNMPLRGSRSGPSLAIWGGGDLSSFSGEPTSATYDGSALAGYLGLDARGAAWLAGVSVSHTAAEADYDFAGDVNGSGTLKTGVTALHPYARLEMGADVELWVIGGFGVGEADLARSHVAGEHSSDLSMAMAVAGLRHALPMQLGGGDLSLRGDAGFLSLETDAGAMALDALSAGVSRLRLGVEAAWEGQSATPFVEVSGRYDGGDGQTGGGLELAAGLRILSQESGFGLEAKGRVLAMHSGDGYGESGFGVTASFEPGTGGRGIVLRISPRWGGSPDATDLFWDEVGGVRDTMRGLRPSRAWGLDAELGYGFGLKSIRGLMTPFGQADITDAADRRVRIGIRYGLMQGMLRATRFEIAAERVDGEFHRRQETRVLARGQARF